MTDYNRFRQTADGKWIDLANPALGPANYPASFPEPFSGMPAVLRPGGALGPPADTPLPPDPRGSLLAKLASIRADDATKARILAEIDDAFPAAVWAAPPPVAAPPSAAPPPPTRTFEWVNGRRITHTNQNTAIPIPSTAPASEPPHSADQVTRPANEESGLIDVSRGRFKRWLFGD
jgi:hypothetical protein